MLCCDILFVLTTAAAPQGGLVLMITIVKTLMTEEQQMTQEVKWSILQFSDICVSSVYLEAVIYEAEVSDVVERKPLLSD